MEEDLSGDDFFYQEKRLILVRGTHQNTVQSNRLPTVPHSLFEFDLQISSSNLKRVCWIVTNWLTVETIEFRGETSKEIQRNLSIRSQLTSCLTKQLTKKRYKTEEPVCKCEIVHLFHQINSKIGWIKWNKLQKKFPGSRLDRRRLFTNKIKSENKWVKLIYKRSWLSKYFDLSSASGRREVGEPWSGHATIYR